MEATTPPPPPPPTPPPAPPAPEPSGRRPISVGGVLSQAFGLYRSNLGVLLGVGFVVAVIAGIIIGLLNDSDSAVAQFIGWIVQLVATAVYTGFVVKLVQDARDGVRDSSASELIGAAMPALGALIINGILYGIGVGIGFILIIIPGLILMTLWSVGQPSIVVEGRGPIEAFGRSYRLVKGQGWTVFGILVCVFLIMIVAAIIAGAIGAAIGGAVGAIIVSILIMLFFMPVQALVAGVLFFELGGGEEAAATPAAPAPAS